MNDSVTARRLALAAVYVQFAALVRTLGEVFRIKYAAPTRYTLPTIEPFTGAALFTAVLLAVSVGTFAAARFRLTIAVAIVNVAALLAYRVAFM